jgi:hypothetical protein
VVYSKQVLSQIAAQNADEYKDIPQLSPDAIVKCIEFFFDDADVPNYVLFDDELIYANKPELAGVMQIWGDGGPILITVNGEELLNKKENWSLPTIKFISIDDILLQLETRIGSLIQ